MFTFPRGWILQTSLVTPCIFPQVPPWGLHVLLTMKCPKQLSELSWEFGTYVHVTQWMILRDLLTSWNATLDQKWNLSNTLVYGPITSLRLAPIDKCWHAGTTMTDMVNMPAEHPPVNTFPVHPDMMLKCVIHPPVLHVCVTSCLV